MPRYRCFCMTDDDRIVTGAFIEAGDVAEAVDAGHLAWRSLAGFHHVEVWLGTACLTAASARRSVQDGLTAEPSPKPHHRVAGTALAEAG